MDRTEGNGRWSDQGPCPCSSWLCGNEVVDKVLRRLTVNIFESGSQCEKNLGVDLSISVLGT